MKRILLLALPFALMTACSNPPAVSNEAATAPAASAAAAASIDAALLGTHHWTLESATDASGKRIDGLFVRADKPVTLDFSNGRIAVGNTCNHLGGSYTLEGGTLEVGSMISTQMACAEPGVMALDGLVSERLQGKLEVRALDAAGLTLVAANGEVLSFRGEPTAETRYGGEGETVLLQIDAQTKHCPHPMIPDKQCLQVREVRYDDKGIEQGERGEFGHFYDAIEGYTHEDGVRNVLRVKRYAVQNPPADASSQAYVLDMVVSSETAKP